MKLFNIYSVLLIVFILSSCDKEFIDPINISDPEVEGSVDNLASLINGIQKRYSTDRAGAKYTTVTASGLTTGELRLINPGNEAEAQLTNGGTGLTINNGILRNLWGQLMLVRKEATTVINAADEATTDTQVANTLKAYGYYYRALAHGTLIQFFEQIPISIERNAAFKTKTEVLTASIEDLEMAQSIIENGLSTAVTSTIFDSVDLENSVQALLARYHLMNGNYSSAITASDNVDLNVISTWEYDAAIPNPIADVYGTNNVVEAKDIAFGLPDNLLPDDNDGRIDFYVTLAQDPSTGDDAYFAVGFFEDNLDQIPTYLPGEVLLIKAEAYARLDQLPQAIDALNEVLTKTASQDVYDLGANLPAYSGLNQQQNVLEEIYRNRRIELFMSGMSLEDSRRFGRPGPNDPNPERNRNYYPYPDTERDNNSNTPDDPII